VPAFDISTLTHAVELDPGSTAQVDFNVQSQLEKAVYARADLEPGTANAAVGAWLSVADKPSERKFEATAAEKYSIVIKVPPDAAAGTYTFRLRMVTTSESASEFQHVSEPVEVTVKPLVPVLAIDTPTALVELAPGGAARVEFTVQSQIDKPVSAHAELKPDAANPAAIDAWLAVEGNEQDRRFEARGAERYAVTVSAPAKAAPGTYTFQLRMVTTGQPASDFQYLSEPVAATVRAAPRNWWPIVAIALGVVNLALLVTAGALLFRGGGGASAVDCSAARIASGVPTDVALPYTVPDGKVLCIPRMGFGLPTGADGVLAVRYGEGQETRIPVQQLLLTAFTGGGCALAEYVLPTPRGASEGRTIEIDVTAVDVHGSTVCAPQWHALSANFTGEVVSGFQGVLLDAP
jgi:hypothetical protein